MKSPPPSTVNKDTYLSTGIDWLCIHPICLPAQQPEKELKPSAYYSQDLIISMLLIWLQKQQRRKSGVIKNYWAEKRSVSVYDSADSCEPTECYKKLDSASWEPQWPDKHFITHCYTQIHHLAWEREEAEPVCAQHYSAIFAILFTHTHTHTHLTPEPSERSEMWGRNIV